VTERWFSDDEIAGQTTLSGITRGHAQHAFLSGWTSESQLGQNAGSEIAVATLQFAFEDLDLHRVEALVLVDNDPVNHLLTNVGFRGEGIAERSLQVNGEWRDHRRYALNAEEWKARRAQLQDA